ncbi:hypothetical protein, partial [Mesorhizobium sp. M7A.F.Ca.CA.004.11.2.1]|uniref:hypothetical protein n=1 Tax=Mesorhizobium sp. M7A.F.Ca.CA.004.11.2.1 TaxID=2496699 RepID=UPI0019D0B42E
MAVLAGSIGATGTVARDKRAGEPDAALPDAFALHAAPSQLCRTEGLAQGLDELLQRRGWGGGGFSG